MPNSARALILLASAACWAFVLSGAYRSNEFWPWFGLAIWTLIGLAPWQRPPENRG